MEKINLQKEALDYFSKENKIYEKALISCFISILLLLVISVIGMTMLAPYKDHGINVFLGMLVWTLFSVFLMKKYRLPNFFIKKLNKNFYKKDNFWKKEYLESLIKKSNNYLKEKDGLIHQIKMKAIDDEELVWQTARELESKSHEAQIILLELEK